MGAEPGAKATVNGQETQKAKKQKEKPAEPAAEAKAEPEAKVAEKAEMPKAEKTATEPEAENETVRLINQFKAELEGKELDAEQQGVYDVMTRQKDKTIIRVQDLDTLKEYVLLKGSRGKGAHKILTVHYAGKRGKVTADEIINIGTVIRNGQYSEGDEKHLTSHTYEMTAEDGARLRVVIDYDKQKNESVINFYSNRKAEDRAHQASSGKTTDSGDTVTPETEKSSEAVAKIEEKAEEKTGDPEVMSLDQFLASRGVAAPISDFMIDKLKIPHGLTARQEQQFHKEAEAARNAYHNKRDTAIEEYERLVAEGKIRKPTIIEEALRKAHGHPDNPSVQAARRVLKKRGIDWRTGEPLAESAEENKTPEATAAPAAEIEEKAAPPRRRTAVEENGEALDNAGRVQLLSSKPAGVNFKDAKVYLDRGSGYSRVRLAEKGNDLYALFTGQNFKNRYIKITDYQNTTPAEVIADIPNQGRNFEDALHDYYDAKGLNLGYAAPLNRMKMPASQSEAPAVKSAEQKFNEAKTFPARCHELIDLNDGSYTINGISFVKDGTLYQVDGLTEKVNARLLTQILGKTKKPAESVVKQNLTTDEGLAVLEEKIYQQEQKMDKLAKYATPASYDARKAEEYYKEKSELDKLRQQYNEMLDAAAAKRPESRPERRRFINDFGEATTREITTATYERAQKRQEQAVLRNKGVKFSLKREPLDVEDFRQMEAHERPEKVHFDSVKDLYHIYEQEYLGQTIRAVSGHNLTFKPGHFFRLIAGTPEGMRKGWIAKAKDAADAIAKIKAGKIDFSDIAGYQDFRAKNIKLFRDVVTNADFWYEENGKITYGKKYAGIKKADGFISVTLDLGNNELGILSFYPHRFTQSFLEGKKIHWHTAQPIERAIASDDVSSMAKSPEFEHTVIEKSDNSSAESQKNVNFPENDGNVKLSKPAAEKDAEYFAALKEAEGEELAKKLKEAGSEEEAKVAEKAEMPKVEESATAKTPEFVKINTVSEITDEDFQKPYRSLELPSLPERTLKAMGKEAKPVLLKQNILEKNRNHHPELSEKDSRETLQKALYENDLVGQSQPSKRPNYWVAVQLSSGKNAVAVLDITETKTHHEIVGWRIINDKSLQALKNQAVREGGQILTSQDDNLRASSDHTEPGNLSNTVTPEAEKSSEAVAKVEEKAEAKNGQPKVEERKAVEKPGNDATVKEPEQPKEKNDFIGEHVFGIPADAVRGKLGGTETKPEQGEETHGNGEVEEGGHRKRQVRDGASAISGGVSEGNPVGSDQGGSAAERSAKVGDAGVGNTEGPGDKSVSGSGRSGRTGAGSGDVERGTSERAGRLDESGMEAGPQLVEENVSGRRESAVLKEEKASPKANDPDAVNHRIGKDDELIAGGDVSKIKANLDALRLLKKLEAENRNATADEKKVLAKYVGWGGLPQVFEREHRNYDELNELLTKEEWDSARGSTLNAHYTERGVIEQMWRLAEKLGFKGGKAGEFGAGIGHFLGLVPDSLAAKTKFRAVELDSVTGRMLQKLYPQADVTVAGLEDTRIANNSLSLVIGNFPFAKLGPNDKHYPKFSLHNYFFARAIDAVKPGGLVIALTSNSTLDNAISLGARKWLSERADLVGAIRLPNNAFKKNAGTEVVTDIIVLRKKDGTRFQGEQFELSAETTCADGSGTARINEYYVNHPEMVLGQHSMTGHMHGRADSYTVLPDKSNAFHQELGKRVDELGKRGEVLGTAQETASLENTPDTGDRKFGEYFIRDGKVLVQGKEGAEEVQGLKAKDKERIESFITLKNRLDEVLKGNRDGVPDAELKKLQQKLKSAYDVFVKKFGNIADTRKQILLRDDPNYMRAAGLEVVSRKTVAGFEKKSYTPADIFTKRVIQKFEEPTKADSLEEAAQISLNLKNTIDPEYVAKLTGMQTEDARQSLLDSGKFFVNPENGKLESASQYLSGNIAEKLKAAEDAAADDKSFQANAEALKKAMPEAKKIDQIGFELGTTWMPKSVVEKWAEQDLGVKNPRIRYSEAGDFWTVEGSFYSVAGYNQDGKSAKDFLEAALNLKRIVINEKNIFGKSVPNKPATLAANELKKQMSERFVNYVKSHPELAEAAEKVYNEKINVVAPRDYQASGDGIYPGAADTVNGKPVRMREHQRALIARAIEGNTLIAHCVGAGKTYEMITTAMELKRLGLASKNLIVVQNATVEQFGESAQALYPGANILCVSKKDFEKKNRKRFLMTVANNNWDIIVMPQSQFNNIKDRPEVEIRYMESKVAELEEACEAAEEAEGKKGLTVKQLAQQIKSLKSKLKTLIDKRKEREEDVVYFDELGIDSLFIDEAHLYKKNFFVSKLPQMKGLDRSSSQRSLSLTLKIRQVMEKTGGRNIYLATGTPVTNTLAEVWNMVRYLYPEGKMPFGCNTFDRFASMFTETKSDVEQTAAGTYKSVERFVKFKNLGDLHKFFTSVADVVLPEDLKGVKRPPLKTGEAQRVIIPRSREITKFMEYLNDLYSWFEGLSGEEKRENSALALQIYSMARKASIDMRLVDASLKDDPNSKLSACARKVAEKYKEYDSVKGTQAVFFDLYKNTDKATDKVLFNAYDELVRKLTALGIPENEIAHMGNDMTDKAKADLFDAVNAGRVRVIIGGTQTLGTGVNIQERLACVHHVDVPQLPADMEQRDGRILRQGNTIPEVEIFQYAVDKTLDSASYQMLARKKAFINDVMKGRLDGESEEKSGDSVSYAEFAAQISGNKDAIRMVKVKADVERLRAMAGAHAQQVRGNRSKLSEEQRAMNTMTAVKGALSENMKTFEAFEPKKITLPNGDVVERKDLIAWLDQYLEKHKGAFKFDFSISGIPVQLERYWSELEDTVKLAYTITIPGLKSGYAKYGGEFKNGTGFMQSFASNIGAKAEEAERLDRRMENQRELLKNLEESINAPFAEAKQLEALEAEYTELAGRLTSNESEKHFDERPDLHDYLDANVNMSAEVEFSEDEEDGEQGDAGKVKMSKPWTGEKEEYPAEWGKCFSQYRGKKYLAVQHLLHRKEGFVPAAFHREDIGDIDIVYGETGEGVEDKRGYGLAHIRKRHPGMDWKLFSQVIQTGELKEINDRRVNIVDGKAKVIIELEWKGQERKWVVSAMGGDLTSTADSLLASNPQEAAKQGIAPKGMVTIGDLWEKSSQKSGKFQENDGGTIKFSIRREEPPKKTRTGYKVFAMFKSHPGELFPPMVANPGGASTPVGVWLNADAAPRAEDSKTGRPRVQSGGKGTNAGKATLAYRPGWHLGPLPEASQFLVKNPETGEAKSMFPENFVFAECEFAADEDYQQEAMSYGYNASGKFQHSLAGLPKVPKDGYYVYRTNPDPKTVPWYISGAMRVKRLLNDRETAEILRENGSRMVPRRGGELDLKAWGFDRTDFTDDGNVKLSKPAGDREIDLMRLERPASTQAEALEALKALSGVNIVNRETGIAAQINRTQRDKLVSNAALDKSKANGFSYEDHFHAVANIDRLFMNGSLVDDRVDRKGNPDVVAIKRFVAPAWLNGDFAEAYITVKETTGNKLYSLELDELKKPSDTKTGGTFKERYHIPEGYDTLLRKVEKAREFFSKNEEKAKLSKPSAKLSEMTDEAKGFVRSLFTNGGQSKPDVNPWAKTFGTIFHYARQVPSLERMFDAAANLAENKTKLLKQLFNGETGRDIPGELRALEAKQPEEYRKLNDYMLKQDRNRAGGFVHVNETDGETLYGSVH